MKPIVHHSMKRFILTYNNRKKHGSRPIISKSCEGCIATNGNVVLFSDELPQRGYLSIGELEGRLEPYGDVTIDYIDDGAPVLPLLPLSLLTKIVLRDLIQTAILEQKVHQLIWYYATKYAQADAENELQTLIKWLEMEH